MNENQKSLAIGLGIFAVLVIKGDIKVTTNQKTIKISFIFKSSFIHAVYDKSEFMDGKLELNKISILGKFHDVIKTCSKAKMDMTAVLKFAKGSLKSTNPKKIYTTGEKNNAKKRY